MSPEQAPQPANPNLIDSIPDNIKPAAEASQQPAQEVIDHVPGFDATPATEAPVEPSTEASQGKYDHLFDLNAPDPTSVEDAAVRTAPGKSEVVIETERQMGIAAADRANRAAAGLPPRVHDLR